MRPRIVPVARMPRADFHVVFICLALTVLLVHPVPLLAQCEGLGVPPVWDGTPDSIVETEVTFPNTAGNAGTFDASLAMDGCGRFIVSWPGPDDEDFNNATDGVIVRRVSPNGSMDTNVYRISAPPPAEYLPRIRPVRGHFEPIRVKTDGSEHFLGRVWTNRDGCDRLIIMSRS